MPYVILAGIAAFLLYLTGKKTLPATAGGDTVKSDIATDTPKGSGVVPYESIFRDAASKEGIDWHLLAAHAYVESSYKPLARKVEHHLDGTYLGESAGLMQILRPLEVNKGALRAYNSGNLPNWEGIDDQNLFDPEVSIRRGAELIRYNIEVFGMPRAIAVYNSFAATRSHTEGPFPNQDYVDKVLRQFNHLQEVAPS